MRWNRHLVLGISLARANRNVSWRKNRKDRQIAVKTVTDSDQPHA